MPHRTRSPPAQGEDCPLEPIAICGQACRLPGSVDSASALWELIVNKRSARNSKVPISRFNIDAHLHSNLERPGSLTAAGGYFLDEDLEDFDPTFFGITPIEAMWMDPQQRKILEVTYECLESAGLSLEDVAGSNTGVYVGCFTNDYQQMTGAEHNFRHAVAATGVDVGIISNKVGNIFNLNGPSFTINTACSSSIYAIHNACHALRANDCEAAIAGGVNLVLTVDQHMNTAKMGVLSPTSTCHTFDESADGYGRAEGVGALYLKRLSDAIRDGNPVRGIIRSSAVNTNGKVDGMAISYPGIEGQERVIRQAYSRSKLDPNRTIYCEAHGTGTAIGDPIEARAVSRAMNDSRSIEKPLIVGAVKPNIGHSEAASGIFAVMKAALMTEAGVIPGICGLKKINPKIREAEWNMRVSVDTRPWPEDGMPRRAGVSSFGYGGTNGHVIVEEVGALHPKYEQGKAKSAADYNHSASRPFLVSLSAHSKATLNKNIEAHAKVADTYYLADLAYTLNQKRGKFAHRAFSIVREGQEAEGFALSAFKSGLASHDVPDVAFVFTGQGAQWAGMGVEAMQTFPRFSRTIDELDDVLQSLRNPPSWTLRSAISALGDKSNINDAEIAQPACTAIQIAIVDLFAFWKISPKVTVGHSSGEIAAAYAAGFISAPEAIIAAYYRGFAVKRNSPVGTMLAVGLGVEEVSKYIDDLPEVVVACENSPASVTLSGSQNGIQIARQRLEDDSVFARELKTGKAYHSPQMAGVAAAYDALLGEALSDLTESERKWRHPEATWISSVTGKKFAEDLTPEYWSRNLRNRVLFNSAITSLGTASELENVRCVVEIGPHSVLSGPMKEIFKANDFQRFTYIPSLVRKADSSHALLGTAGSLFVQNHTVDLGAVNAVEYIPKGLTTIKTALLPLMLVDLPHYQWNYEKKYWAEPRLSHEQRHIKYGRHDVLGMRIVGLADDIPTWSNRLRHKDLPWLEDHKLGKVDVFPAAGHFSLAVEAVRQLSEEQGLDVKGVSFRDISISTALVIPEEEDGIEIQFTLSPMKQPHDTSTWYHFTVESITDGVWSKHCEGTVCALLNESRVIPASLPYPVEVENLQQLVPSRRWYKAFDRVGFEYGPSFRKLGTIRTDGKNFMAVGDVEIVTESGVVQEESRYIIHPATIDSCLHLAIVAINKGLHKEMKAGVVPVDIEQVSLWFPEGEANTVGNAVAWADRPPQDSSTRFSHTHTKLYTPSRNLILEIQNMRIVKYEAAVPASTKVERPRAPYMQTSWKPDIMTMRHSKLLPASLSEAVELLDHKKSLKKVAFICWSEESLQTLLPSVAPETDISICDTSAESLEKVQSAFKDRPRITTFIAKEGSFFSSTEEETSLPAQDAVILNAEQLYAERLDDAQNLLSSVKEVLGDSGHLVVQAKQHDNTFGKVVSAAGFSPPKLEFDSARKSICLYSAAPYMNGFIPVPESITLLTFDPSSSATSELASSLSSECRTIDVVNISNVKNFNKKVVIYDDGRVLSSLTEKSFNCLKKVLLSKASIVWITSGVNEGNNVDGSMVQGFLRTIRCEQATAKIVLLDTDRNSTNEDISRCVISKLQHASTKDSGADTEFWLHNGAVHVDRVVPNAHLNQRIEQDRLPGQMRAIPRGKALSGALEDGELIFTRNARFEQQHTAHEVEVQVSAAEFDLVGSGKPRLVAGKVIKEGSAVPNSMLGQEVLTFATDSYSTIIRAPASDVVPISGSAAVDLIASLPPVQKVWNALITLGEAQSGDQVLVLPTSSAIATVVSTFASVFDFSFTIVAESKQKEEDLIACGIDAENILLARGAYSHATVASFVIANRPRIILAHDFQTLSQDIWRLTPALGRFVLYDTIIDAAPDVHPFTRGAAFLSTSIKELFSEDPAALAMDLRCVIEKWSQLKKWTKASPISISSLKDSETIKEAKLISNAVMTYEYDSTVVTANIRETAPPLRLDPDSTYLLVGCLGGLGRSLTTWMMDRGARSFAFISRSGDDKPEAARVVANIRKAGLDAQVYRADASNEAEVKKVVKSIKRRIRGVVHAAMVLQDGMFERMTYDKFMTTINPKVQGAKALEKALESEGKASDLDFFVMTSSITATVGNPGQSNYAAANSFLDGLAWHRNLKGLPGVALVLPMVLDVGVVAENENIELSLARQGMYGIDEGDMLRGFETAMLQRVNKCEATLGNAQIILGLEPAELAAAAESNPDRGEAFWLPDVHFQQICRSVEDIERVIGNVRHGEDENFSSQLKLAIAEGPEAVIHTIAEHVMQRCSRILMVPQEDLSFDEASVASYGLDSMIGAELVHWLFKEFGLDISFQHLLAPTMTFKKLANTIAETMGVLH